MTDPVLKRRCAIYTRKSSDECLEQEFNSLDAQYEACAAFITSQAHEGWIRLSDRYDDGGVSGGSMERPALKRLLADIEGDAVDVIVVYKVDRLTRSLADFARLVEAMDQHGVSFVSVTQQFNTTSSMGRLTLNILLSFAQFERELSSERIRDKIAASRKRGMWMGGRPPLGYDVKERELVINEAEAALVYKVFTRFLSLGSTHLLMEEINTEGHTTKSWMTQAGHFREGRPFDKAVLYKMLNNRTYLGEAVHKGQSYPGKHKAIIDQALWDDVHSIFSRNASKRRNNTRASTPAPLKGLLQCESCGRAMTPSHTRRHGRLYRYYQCMGAIRNGAASCPVRSVPAGQIEGLVLEQVRGLLRAPEVTARVAAKLHESDLDLQAHERENLVHEGFRNLDQVWEELFPAEQARVLQLLIEEVRISPDGAKVHLRENGLTGLSDELGAPGA